MYLFLVKLYAVFSRQVFNKVPSRHESDKHGKGIDTWTHKGVLVFHASRPLIPRRSSLICCSSLLNGHRNCTLRTLFLTLPYELCMCPGILRIHRNNFCINYENDITSIANQKTYLSCIIIDSVIDLILKSFWQLCASHFFALEICTARV